jgi:site-specific DNA recombinase
MDQIATLKQIKKVAGILRISTEKTDFEGKKIDAEATLKNHEVQMLNFFDEWGIELILYKEVLSGGSEYEDRKELQKALNDLKNPNQNFDAICVIELERFARDTYVSAMIKKACEDSGALIISLSPFQILDMNNSNDSLMFGLASVIAEHNRKIASNRVKLNKISMARQGLNSSGSVPFGYVRNPKTKRLEIDYLKDDRGDFILDEQGNKIEAQSVGLVRQIFDWYMDGEGQRSICDKLNGMGITNKQGNKWIPNSLRVLLTCETYKGTLIARNWKKYKGKLVEVEEDTVIIENNHDAIIEPEIFDKAQNYRNLKKERSGIDQRNNDWNSKQHMSILDGLIYCGCPTCGRKSTIKWYTDKNSFYIIKCSKFNASGKTCNNGGISEKDLALTILNRVESYKNEIENKLGKVKSNDFQDALKDLQDKLSFYEHQKETLQNEFKALWLQEKDYKSKGIKDDFEEELLAEGKITNAAQRQAVETKIQEYQAKLKATPSTEKETKRLQAKLDIIEHIFKKEELEEFQVNALLKQILLKVEYTRVLPDNYKSLPKAEKDKLGAELKYYWID